MKLILSILLCFCSFVFVHAQTDIDKAGSAIKGLLKKKPKTTAQPAPTTTPTPATTDANASANTTSNTPQTTDPPSTKAYANYDFVPGDTVLFEDDFIDDQDGEFPAHWDLKAGQAVLNKLNGTEAFYLTEGNYVRVYPRMKKKAYLTDPFTIEFDYYPTSGAYGPVMFVKHFNAGGDEEEANIKFDTQGGVSTGYFTNDMEGTYPGEKGDAFYNKWHHGAMIYKNGQIKCYVDQYRVMIMPNSEIVPVSLGFGGIGDPANPIIIKNVRIAAGGNMNMTGKKFTDAKIVTHGITFDVDQSTMKPESMGTLNMVAGVLKSNPDIKFEIDGHTDNTGAAAHNMTLSQQRAEAVKTQLISMGIDAGRLTTKGFGDSKPMGTNDTPEGKANNRRVEFVKK